MTSYVSFALPAAGGQPKRIFTAGLPAALLVLASVMAAFGAPGMADSDWKQIRAEYERHRHAAVSDGDSGLKARNFGQQITARFDGRGFTVEPDSGAWTWGLELQRYGFEGQEQPAHRTQAPLANGNRIALGRGPLEEWWVNDAHGLEHGFTVRERPVGSGGRLVFDLGVRGGLRAAVAADGQSVSFVGAGGAALVNYGGLKVWDAAGNVLPAVFEAGGGGVLRLAVEERGVVYPITVDPIVQQAYLKASNTDREDEFGYSVAISGDTIVVGARYERSSATGVNGNQADNSVQSAGAAYVFVRTGGVWSQQAYLKASNPDPWDQFGYSVAISGGTIVVGALGEGSRATGVNGNQSDNSAESAGAAYAFVRNGTLWSQQAYLKASNTDLSDIFGVSVAISGDTIVVGAGSEDSSATGVNSNQADNSALEAGAAYVFVRNGGMWSQQAYLKASNTDDGDFFGCSVAISGDSIVVGARDVRGYDSRPPNASAAYVFVRNGGMWSQQALLKASNRDVHDGFGELVAISGDTIVVGAPYEDSAARGVNGNQADNSAPDAGAAYVFVRSGGLWSQQAYLKASNSEANDYFGESAAISGDTIVIGAWGEDSAARGVNGNQTDNSIGFAGAAYVFVHTGGLWSQLAYIKPSNTESGNLQLFADSVAISGDTIVVGAPYEDSAATGVNGDQHDGNAPNSGAAYVLIRGGVSEVNVYSSPAGLLFNATGAGCEPGTNYVTPRALAWTPGSNCQLQFATPQGAAGTRHVFSQWENGLTNPLRSITAPGVYTATFSTQYLLTTVANPTRGGKVSPATGYQNAGNVFVSAEPACGYRFSNWSGATVSNGQVLLTGPLTLTANFAAAPVTALAAQRGSILTVRGTPLRYRQTVKTINTVGMTADVLFVLSGVGPGVTVVSPASPTGITNCVAPAGRPFYAVPNVPPGHTAQITFVLTAPNSQSVVYSLSAIASLGPR